jgi:predicted transcriptional regulator
MSFDQEIRELVREVVREEIETRVEAAVRSEITRLQAPRRWATVSQTAVLLGIGEAAVRQRIRRGQLDSRVLDGRRYVDLEAHRDRLDSLLPCPQPTNDPGTDGP